MLKFLFSPCLLETQHIKESTKPVVEQKPLIEFKVNDHNLLNQSRIQVPPYKQIYPSPYIPIQHPLPDEYPYVTGVPGYGYPHMNPYSFIPNNS